MIYLTGDTHGDVGRLTRKCWPLGKALTKNDYLIVLGDFGLLWDGSDTDKHWLKWLDAQPWTTLWLDGNHENFDMIAELETVEMFGEDVGKVNDSVFHLRRGRVYNIDGNRLLTIGGGLSIDKMYRKEGKSWWPGELLSLEDVQRCWDAMADAGMEVDYVLTHTCPKYLLPTFGIVDKLTDPVSFHLEDMSANLKFKHWYFGHLHHNRTVGAGMEDVKFTCLHEEVLTLGEVL